MRKLMNTEKAYAFSKKYGIGLVARINKFASDEQLSSNKRIQFLIDTCKIGLFDLYWQKAKSSEIPFFIDRLIEYKTLAPELIDIYRHSCMDAAIGFDTKIFNKIFNFFIKNKNCSGALLAYARELNYPGIDEIYAKIFNSILVNEPLHFIEVEASAIKKEYLERYLKALPPKYINIIRFGDIIYQHDDLNPNEVGLISKIFLKEGITLRLLLNHLIGHHQNYIPTICRVASKIKKITEDDIIFLYKNNNINQIKNVIFELGLKLPKDLFSFDKINMKIHDSVSKIVLRYSTVVLCFALYNNIKDNYNIPELSNIIKSDPNGFSEESKMHAAIIKEYKKHDLDLNLIYKDCKSLDRLANDNPIQELFSKLGGGDDYYNKQLEDYPVTPYNLYRYNIYAVMANRIY